MKKVMPQIASFIRTIGAMFNPAGPAAQPHCHNISALLLHLCDYDRELHHWVLRWIAYPLRNPGAKMDTAIIINGGSGAGKAMFFKNVVANLHGYDARHLSLSNVLDNQGLQHRVAGAHFVVVSGLYSRALAGRLMSLIEPATRFIREPYGRQAREVPNQLNLVLVSRSEDFIPLSADYRFVVIEAPPAHGSAFYASVIAEISGGGIEVFREYLLHELYMGDFGPATRPTALPGLPTTAASMAQAGGLQRRPVDREVA